MGFPLHDLPGGDAGATSDADLERLRSLARSAGPLRRAAVAVAGPMVERRGWERLGYARVGDYAVERLGLSGRTLLEWARVERSLDGLPQLEAALATAQLPWSKVRLLARFAESHDESDWIARAEMHSVRVLERELRAVDREALPSSGGADAASSADQAQAIDLDEEGLPTEPRERIGVRVPRRVAFAWNETHRVAAQVAGERISRDVALELVTAEVLSALPGTCGGSDEEGSPGAATSMEETTPSGVPTREPPDPIAPPLGEVAPTRRAELAPMEDPLRSPPLPDFLAPLVAGLEDADPFELDARLRRIVRLGQRLDAEIAPLLRRLGSGRGGVSGTVRNVEAIARERLGLSPRKARALARLDRLGDDCPTLRRAFREATISWVQAQALAPLFLGGDGALSGERGVSQAPGGDSSRRDWREDWVAFAGHVTVRRLEDAVERALSTGERDPEQVDASVDARTDEMTDHDDARATAAALESESARDPLADTGVAVDSTWQTCARPTPPGNVVRITVHATRDVARLFRATLASVRKRLELEWGRLPSEGEAFEAMLEHARATWELEDPSLKRCRKRHRVFVRDGWQCTVPGCRSRRNLQAHHIIFRSAGGGDEL
ncbi:MAG: hypothetical protein ACX98W_05240, partial [bacterium]